METRITFEQAQSVASSEIARRAVTHNPPIKDFMLVQLRSETADVWSFVSVSEQLIDDGFVPGAITVQVDKTDGHILTDQEAEERLNTRIHKSKGETLEAA